jgi:hypothetical protein
MELKLNVSFFEKFIWAERKKQLNAGTLLRAKS